MYRLVACCVVALLGSIVLAQNEPPTGDGVGDTCWNGTVNVVNGTETGPVNRVACSFDENSCQTKIEVQAGTYKVDRECNQRQACENNAEGNFPKCYPGENGVRLCHYCCNTDDCNDFNDIPVILNGPTN